MRIEIKTGGLTGIVLALLLLMAPANAAETPTPRLFGATEIRNTNLAAFVKWDDMTARDKWERAHQGLKQPCRVTIAFICRRDEWRDLLVGLRNASALKKLSDVNAFMNKAPYITDIRNWGVPDYWATVREFLRKNGDCEDYAIAKYYSLKALGFDPNSMRVVIVEDTNLNIAHAILTVNLNGKILILDNQMTDVVNATSIVHYRPIYAINEHAWWLYRPQHTNRKDPRY